MGRGAFELRPRHPPRSEVEVRRIAINLLKQDKLNKRSIPSKEIMCAHNEHYVLKMLISHTTPAQPPGSLQQPREALGCEDFFSPLMRISSRRKLNFTAALAAHPSSRRSNPFAPNLA